MRLSTVVRIAVFLLPISAFLVSLCTSAQAQDEGTAIPDTTFVPRSHEPISYYTSYDRNISRAAWMQTLGYAHNAKRVSFNLNAAATTVNALNGLKSDGLDGDFSGSVNVAATKNWTWALDGRFGLTSNNDELASTDRRENKLQLRTQYRFNPIANVSAMGLVFAEFQEDQSLGDRTIPVAVETGF